MLRAILLFSAALGYRITESPLWRGRGVRILYSVGFFSLITFLAKRHIPPVSNLRRALFQPSRNIPTLAKLCVKQLNKQPPKDMTILYPGIAQRWMEESSYFSLPLEGKNLVYFSWVDQLDLSKFKPPFTPNQIEILLTRWPHLKKVVFIIPRVEDSLQFLQQFLMLNPQHMHLEFSCCTNWKFLESMSRNTGQRFMSRLQQDPLMATSLLKAAFQILKPSWNPQRPDYSAEDMSKIRKKLYDVIKVWVLTGSLNSLRSPQLSLYLAFFIRVFFEANLELVVQQKSFRAVLREIMAYFISSSQSVDLWINLFMINDRAFSEYILPLLVEGQEHLKLSEMEKQIQYDQSSPLNPHHRLSLEYAQRNLNILNGK